MDKKSKTLWLVEFAMLLAIEVIMSLTPVGYLKVGVVSITFLAIPVVVGAIVLGAKAGAMLGFVFGLTSFIQCFGMDPFGTALFGINPYLTAILCLVPRTLMGFLVALIFKAIEKIYPKHITSYLAASLSGSLLNTALFVGMLVLFFGRSEYLSQFGKNIFAILSALITFNAIIEAGVCMIVGSAVSRALNRFIR